MREQTMIRHALRVIGQFNPETPLHRQLAAYFKLNKSMGSRDRKEVRALVYPYFRIGNALPHQSAELRLAIGNFLCARELSPTLQVMFQPTELPVADIQKSLQEKMSILKQLYPDFETETIFPCSDYLSPRIDKPSFLLSMLQQPLVWIRVRSDFINEVEQEFRQLGITYTVHPERSQSWSFDPAVKLTETESYRFGYFEIQDLSSQLAGEEFAPASSESWWDACAASGGKSLQLLEKERNIQLLATDVRNSILENYRDRLKRAGFNPTTQVMDLALESIATDEKFDAIIADVPCSGSGTWSRTPEMITGFPEQKLKQFFVPLQRSILYNLSRQLNTGGRMYFITCSAFYVENEENVDWLLSTAGMKLMQNAYLQGMNQRADTMFLAVLVKT